MQFDGRMRRKRDHASRTDEESTSKTRVGTTELQN